MNLPDLGVAESPLFDPGRLEGLVAKRRIRIASLRKMRNLVNFDRFYVRGEAVPPEIISRDDREAPSRAAGAAMPAARRGAGTPERV